MIRAAALALAVSVAAWAEDKDSGFNQAVGRLESFVRSREVKPLDEEPSWAENDGAPLVRFVQYSDIHHNKGGHDADLARAIEFTNAQIKPDWVVCTGDNISGPYTEAHHKELKGILDGELKCPYYIIKGDNDERDFETVFGSSRWSFDCAGVHFIGVGLDNDAEGIGIGYLDGSTYSWLAKDLREHKDEPTVFFMHVNMVPPDFLDAPRLGAVLSLRRNLVATVTGHLHMDLEERVGQVTHIIAPAIGPNPRHGIKLYEVHEDHITVKTYDVVDGRYAFANKWQEIPFPKRLRADAGKGKAVVEYAAADPLPTTWSPGLVAFDAGARDWLGRLYRLVGGGK